MTNLLLVLFKVIFMLLNFSFVENWSPSCSPCNCFSSRFIKISNCSYSTTLNKFTRIPRLNIDTEAVFLNDHNLGRIPEDAFFSGRTNNLKTLDLKDSEVRSIHEYAFRNLNHLTKLDLSHNKLLQFDKNIFQFNKRISVLILQHNLFQVFHPNVFSYLKELSYLDLSYNNLRYISPNQFENNVNLKRLFLQFNQLGRIDVQLLINLPKLNVLYLNDNPWSCNCQTKEIQQLIIFQKIDFVNNNHYPICFKPTKWKNKKWLEVKPRELCSETGPSSSNLVEGNDFIFNCTIKNFGNIPVQWSHNGQNLTIDNNKHIISYKNLSPILRLYTLTIKNINLQDKGGYKCFISNGKELDYDESSLIVTPGTEPSFEPFENINNVVKSGTRNFVIPCRVYGSPQPSIKWSINKLQNCQYSIKTDTDSFGTWSNLTIESVSSYCAGNFKCKATNVKGDKEQDYNLKVLPVNPPIITNTTNNIVDETKSISLNCFVSDSVGITAKWLHNEREINLNNKYEIKVDKITPISYNYILIIKDISSKEAGDYKCRINDLDSSPFKVQVNPATKPQIDFETDNLIVESGTNEIVIPCKANGIPKPKISWSIPPINCNYSTQESKDVTHLILKNLNLSCAGIFKCIAYNSKGSNEKELKLSVSKLEQPVISTETNYFDNEIIENSDLVLKCLIKGSVQTKPKWKYEDKIINSNDKYMIDVIEITETSFWYNLVIPNIKIEDAGYYKCTLGDFESSTLVEVTQATKPTIEYITNPETVLEEGRKNISLVCKVSGVPKPEVTWIHPNNNCKIVINSDENIKSEWVYLTIIEVTPACGGKYKCIARSPQGTSERDVELSVISMQEPPKVELDSNSVDGITEDENIVLKCFIRGSISQPQWLHENNIIIPNLKYRIDKILINQTSYWYNLIISNISVKERGNYKCRVNNFETNISIDVKPNVAPAIEYISKPNTIVEEGQKDLTFICKVSGIPKPETYWYHNENLISNSLKTNCNYVITKKTEGYIEWLYLTIPEVELLCGGKYKCASTNSKGSDENEFRLSVIKPEINIETNSIDNKIIENSNITLQCLIRGSINSKPQWLFNNQPINRNLKHDLVIHPIDQTSFWYNLIIFKVGIADGGHYKCKINNLEKDFVLNVEPGSKPLIEQIPTPNIDIEEGQNIILPCKASGNPKPSTYWLFENKPIENVNNICQYLIVSENNWNNLTLKNTDYSCTGKYKCVSKNLNGISEKEINLNVHQLNPPQIEISTDFDNNLVVENEKVVLKCLVPDVKYKVEWFFNDQLVVLEPNGRYFFNFIPINQTAYWYSLDFENILFNDQGKYTCKIKNVESSIELKLHTKVVPTIEYVPSYETIVEEGAIQFKIACKITGDINFEANWLSDSNQNCEYLETFEKTNNSQWIYLTFPKVTPSCSGSYKCVTKNIFGMNSKDVHLSVIQNQALEITVTSNSVDGEIREQNEVILKCLSTTNINSKLQWYYNNKPIISNDKFINEIQKINAITAWNILKIKNVSLKDQGRFVCRQNNVEQSYDLKISPALIPTVEYFTDPKILIEEQSELTIPCKVTGDENAVIQWIFENRRIEESSCMSISEISHERNKYYQWYNLTIINITKKCSGQYKCIVNNENNKNDINISVVPINRPKIQIETDSSDKIIREQDSIILKCLIVTKDINKAKWLYNGYEVISNNRFQITTNIVNSTTYWYNLEIKNILINESGDYQCYNGKYRTSSIVEVQRGFKPVIEYISNAETIAVAETKDVTFVCKVGSAPKADIVWKFSSQLITKGSSCKFETFSEDSKNYQWSYLRINQLKSNCMGSFKCIASNYLGYVEKAINLTVIPIEKPKISLISSSSDKIIREGDNITLSCIVNGGHNSYIKWYTKLQFQYNYNAFKLQKNDINPTTKRTDLIISNISLEHSGIYKCWANNLAEEIVLKVYQGIRPSIDQISKNLVVDRGTKETVISCKVSGIPAPEVDWFYNNIKIDETQSQRCKYTINNLNYWKNLTINDPNKYCTGSYKCSAKSFKGVDEKIVNLTVVEPQLPAINISSSSPGFIKENDNITLKCLIKGDINSNPQWILNKNIIKHNDKYKIIKEKIDEVSFWYNLEIPLVNLKDKGQYKCEFNQKETVIYLEVQPLIKPQIESLQQSKIYIHSGIQELMLPCKIKGIPKPSVNWSHNDNLINENSQCPNNCKYMSVSEFTAGNEWKNLIINNITTSCSGLYKCSAENTKGSTEKTIEVVVIPPDQPEVKIDKSIHSILNSNVQVSCEVKSIVQPNIIWKLNNKVFASNENKYHIRNITSRNDLYYSIVTILSFQQSDVGNYSCEVEIYKKKVSKTVPINMKTVFKPYFLKNTNFWDYFQINNHDLTFTTKVKGYPPPKLTWLHKDTDVNLDVRFNENMRRLTEVSNIEEDLYWFNQTIKDFAESDFGSHVFVVENELGKDELKFILKTDKSESTSGKIEIFVDQEDFVPLPDPS